MISLVISLIGQFLDSIPFNLPPMPEVLSNATSFFSNYATNAIAFLSYLYSQPYLTAIFAILVSYIGFVPLWYLGNYILRRLGH